jgi:hypothetical protein
VLDRFRNAIGAGKVYGPYGGGMYVFRLLGESNTKSAMVKLWPYLDEIKRLQFQTALSRWNARSNPRALRCDDAPPVNFDFEEMV